jgi:hypothetical protein
LLPWLRIATLAAATWCAAAASAQPDAGVTITVETRTERPPEGSMRRGLWQASAPIVYAFGAACVVCAAGFLIWRAKKR